MPKRIDPSGAGTLDGLSDMYLHQFQMVEEADFAEFATEYTAPIPKKHVVIAKVSPPFIGLGVVDVCA
jgi:hypothetical protein